MMGTHSAGKANYNNAFEMMPSSGKLFRGFNSALGAVTQSIDGTPVVDKRGEADGVPSEIVNNTVATVAEDGSSSSSSDEEEKRDVEKA